MSLLLFRRFPLLAFTRALYRGASFLRGSTQSTRIRSRRRRTRVTAISRNNLQVIIILCLQPPWKSFIEPRIVNNVKITVIHDLSIVEHLLFDIKDPNPQRLHLINLLLPVFNQLNIVFVLLKVVLVNSLDHLINLLLIPYVGPQHIIQHVLTHTYLLEQLEDVLPLNMDVRLLILQVDLSLLQPINIEVQLLLFLGAARVLVLSLEVPEEVLHFPFELLLSHGAPQGLVYSYFSD